MRVAAVIHPTGLLGKELRERLERRADLCGQIRLLTNDEEEVGRLTESAGAAAVVARLDEASLDGIDLAFFCGEIESDRRALELLPKGVPAVLLSRGATSADGPGAVGGVRAGELAGHDRAVSPPPAAVGVVHLLAALAGYRPLHAEATALLSVSDLDEEGIDDLFEETRGILTFSGRPASGRFAAQIAFNLLPARDDAEACARLAEDALGGAPPISLQLGRGGIFHGLALSVHVELEQRPTPEEVRAALGCSDAVELAEDSDSVGPVAVAGEERILVGAVRAGARPGSYWIWAAMDNLIAGGAENALGVAAALLAGGPPS